MLTDSILSSEMHDTFLRFTRGGQPPPGNLQTFDTVFGRQATEQWSFNGVVYQGRDVNYFGVGMYMSWYGFTYGEAVGTVRLWKSQYDETRIEQALYWMTRGYVGYNGSRSRYPGNMYTPMHRPLQPMDVMYDPFLPPAQCIFSNTRDP